MKNQLMALTALLLTACEHPIPPSPSPRPALVVTVGKHTSAPPTILVGEIRSRYESTQGFRIAGKIIGRYVDVGARVRKGQVLAKLDNIDAGLTAQAAQAEVSAAEADLALARAELNRLQQLHLRKFISDQALDIQEAQVKATAARVEQVRAQASVSSNQTRYTDLVADRDGVIIEIHAEPGQVVEAGEAITRIAVPSTLEAVIAVPESRMNGIVVDTPAEVRLWTDPNTTYSGKIREVAPVADSATRTFQVRVTLTDVDSRVHMGMTAGVRFYHQDNHDWLLPLPAVTQRDGHNVVWVVEPHNGQVQPKTVTTGLFREDGVLISAGLQEGDQVVVAGVQTLVPGQVVRPQPVRSE